MTSVATKFDLDLWFETSRYPTQDSVICWLFWISRKLLNMTAFFQIKQKPKPCVQKYLSSFEPNAPVEPLSCTKLSVKVVVQIVRTSHCKFARAHWRKYCLQFFWLEMGDVVFFFNSFILITLGFPGSKMLLCPLPYFYHDIWIFRMANNNNMSSTVPIIFLRDKRQSILSQCLSTNWVCSKFHKRPLVETSQSVALVRIYTPTSSHSWECPLFFRFYFCFCVCVRPYCRSSASLT